MDSSTLTAQPDELGEELHVHQRNEEGLSMEPEEMGRQFLNDAMEAGDFEAAPNSEDDELQIDSGPRSDEALTGPNFDPDEDVWSNTVNQTMAAGTSDRALEELAPAMAAVERNQDDEDDLEREGPNELDVSEDNLHDASLFDFEGDELGEVRSPSLNTEDTHHHARHRGPRPPRR
ncbi:MAG: hypothetical protein QM778_23555 [Myxococcales bacterium]